MKENIISFSSEDFERLKKLIDSREYGFPVLAMHSLAEREIAKANGYDYTKDAIEFTFSDLCGMLSLTGKQKKSINEIKNDRNDYANYVRHGFKNLTPMDASLVESRFLDFVKAFNPAAENLKEYMEVKESVKLALNDRKMITISEDKYNEMLQAYPELRSTQARLDDAIRRYDEEHAKVEVLNKKLLDSEDKYKTDIKAVNDKYDEKRQELFKSKRAGEIQITELEKAKDAELRGIQAQHDAKIGKLSAERDEYLAELEKSKRIVDVYDFASQYYAYSEGRRSFIRSMMNLSRQQREIVDSVNLNSDFLIRGGAGSGKTLVLLAILKRLNEGMLDGMGSTCRFLTYTNTLSHFSKVIMPELAQTSGLDNRTVSSFLYWMTKDIFNRRFLRKDSEIAELTETLSANPDYVQEIRLFIWSKNVDKETYLGGCERRGMKEGIGVEERKKIWTALEELDYVLENENVNWPEDYAVVRLLEEYENHPEIFNQYRCDYILVDEFQDLSPAKLSLMKKLSNTAVYLAGDASQSIYKKAQYTLKETGINIEGRTRILDQCFRSTRQINDVCRKYRDDADVKTEGKDAEEDVVNIRSGLPVSLQVFENSEKCLGYLLDDVRALQTSMKVPLKDICIIAYTNWQIDNIRGALEEAGIKTTIIDASKVKNSFGESMENNIFESDSVKLMTIHSSKGLEFPCVLFYGKEYVVEKGINQQSRDQLKKDLVYVALTRACSILHIFYDRSTQSDALDLLDSEINPKSEPVTVVQNSTNDDFGDDNILFELLQNESLFSTLKNSH